MSQSIRHLAAFADLGATNAARVLAHAAQLKQSGAKPLLAGKSIGLLFADPSLRTRTSMDQACHRLGGRALALDVGASTWQLETADGVRMDADKPEHVREAAPVLSQYLDGLGVRAFSRTGTVAEEDADQVLQAFKRHASVPVLNLESAREHPCQGMADMLTVQEEFGACAGTRIALSWAPHIKRLPRAVPNSVLLSAAAMGCQISVAAPIGYELAPGVMAQAQELASASGGSVTQTRDQAEALSGCQVLYAKAWGATAAAAPADEPALANWMPTLAHFDQATANAIFMHCLPVRRDVEIAAEVLDSARSRVITQAGNRLYVQMALLAWLFGHEF